MNPATDGEVEALRDIPIATDADANCYHDELMKIAVMVGEPDDPFAAWESIAALLARLDATTSETAKLRERVEESFQQRVRPWMMACFGAEISGDVVERNHRFLEEALELVQSTGCTASEAHQLVDYVFGRPSGDPPQESGGVMVTHAALCLAAGMDMHANGEAELARIWTKVEKIRAKQAAKPKHSPLPQHLGGSNV